MHRSPLFTIPLSLLLVGCAQGGGDERPSSEVLLTTSLHMFGFKSLVGFGQLPLPPRNAATGAGVAITDRGTLHFFDDSRYTVARTSGTGGDDYALAANGELTLYSTGSGREPTVLLRGGYEQVAATADAFFTDRDVTAASPAVGLFYATEVTETGDDLAGEWHLFSLHVILGESQLTADSVARAAWSSSIVIDGAPAAGAPRAISGTGSQTGRVVNFGGTIAKLLGPSGTGDGTCNLTIDYDVAGMSSDSRIFRAASGPDIVLALDEDQSDGETGLAFLLRQFDSAAPADPASVVGDYFVGGYTAFVNPDNPGSDAFLGVAKLQQGGAFRLDAVGHQGFDFVYQGTWTLASNGGLTFSIDGTNETWHGAIDPDYRTLVLLDDVHESRSSGVIELNLCYGVREKPVAQIARIGGETVASPPGSGMIPDDERPGALRRPALRRAAGPRKGAGDLRPRR